MNELRFIQVEKDNSEHCESFKAMMLPYSKEIGANYPDGTPISDEVLLKWTQSCINMQGPHDRHMELAYVGDVPIGFLYGKVDHEGHRGFINPEYGYIMEFYVKPEHRHKGYGRIMLRRLERHFSGNGVKRMYLTTGTSEGEAFWRAMGFAPTGEMSPDNEKPIFEKDVTEIAVVPMQNEHVDFVIALLMSDHNKTALHLSNRSATEWRKCFIQNLADPDEANFIILVGEQPAAWLKLNGMSGGVPCISMLVVDDAWKRHGIGSLAVRYAEDYAKGFQKAAILIQTTADNIAATQCYVKQGYVITRQMKYAVDDGIMRDGYEFRKDL